ncbi:MAG: NYN domain-containing protein [Gemmatimonadetes bacterium]|nr:NYN domain-containing protein [Gemmatimonadota bacterium]
MGTPYTRAPHQGGPGSSAQDTPHAALLIDFDNVTMGMRSDLSKELKSLLDNDVIKGKVSVQRAYADWRRYPQYIVPLSEASVDLIFAPAYGSNKKNATDIRMAIDAVELVFIRPEIGTYILLTGDSDFSSLVLKLKEYGKYVIGVGIQESSSDILVQNCDEYYSYTSLTGLTKTTELHQAARDPWVLVAEALKKMVARGDVMRSDRLKQVMQELDANFDESGMGFSKFSKFLAEASSRGLVKLKKLENGQYQVGPMRGRGRRTATATADSREASTRRGGGRGRRDRNDRDKPDTGSPSVDVSGTSDDPLQDAYALLTAALEDLRAAGRESIRDSDVKRKILQKDRAFDEAELGFPKFSKFLAQAAEHGIIGVERTDRGNFQVRLLSGASDGAAAGDAAPELESRAAADDAPEIVSASEPATESTSEPATESAPEPESGDPRIVEVLPSDLGDLGLRLGPRRGSTRRRGADDQPLLFEGQAFSTSSPAADAPESASASVDETPADAEVDLDSLGLPSDADAIVRYLTHRYKGVGEKTAKTLVERFGTDLFRTLRDDPAAISAAVPPSRAEQLLDAWRADYTRRTSGESDAGGSKGGRGGRRGGRGRGPRSRS